MAWMSNFLSLSCYSFPPLFPNKSFLVEFRWRWWPHVLTLNKFNGDNGTLKLLWFLCMSKLIVFWISRPIIKRLLRLKLFFFILLAKESNFNLSTFEIQVLIEIKLSVSSILRANFTTYFLSSTASVGHTNCRLMSCNGGNFHPQHITDLCWNLLSFILANNSIQWYIWSCITWQHS